MKTLLQQLNVIYKVSANNWVHIVDQNNQLVIKCPIVSFNQFDLIPDLMNTTKFQVTCISSNVYFITVER